MDLILGISVGALVAGVIFGLLLWRKQRELAEAASQTAILRSRVDALTRDLDLSQSSVQQLTEQRVSLSGEREALRASLTSVQQGESRARSELHLFTARIEEAQKTISRVESDSRLNKRLADEATRVGAECQQRLDEATSEAKRLNVELTRAIAEVSSLKSERENLTSRLVEQKRWIEEQTAAMEQRVKSATDQLLKEKAQEFAEVNKRELGTVINPFRDSLSDFRKRVDDLHSEDARAQGELKQQIIQLTDLNQTVSKRAEDLTNALTISSKATGVWGETILARILETSGLREGREYLLQHAVTGANGERRILDALVNLPEARHVIVDSKVSNKAWTDYCSATRDEDRELHLQAHLASLRAHIRGLSEKDYCRAEGLNTVDFVLMFVPVEGALVTAFSEDDSLYATAYRSKIVLVSPSTLMAVLKLIEGMWLYQRRKESADKIAEAGRKLYDKMSTFATAFIDVGRTINKAHDTYEKAHKLLVTGRGSAISLAERMRELGVSPTKVLPAEILTAAELNTQADDPLDNEDASDALPGPAA
jgi:DNA recombination protein RmuC